MLVGLREGVLLVPQPIPWTAWRTYTWVCLLPSLIQILLPRAEGGRPDRGGRGRKWPWLGVSHWPDSSGLLEQLVLMT